MNLQKLFELAGVDATKGKAKKLIESDQFLSNSYVVVYQTDAPEEKLGVFDHPTPIINSIHECEDEIVDFRSGTRGHQAEQRLMVQLKKLDVWIKSETGPETFTVSGIEGDYVVTRQPGVASDQITPWDF